MNDSEVILNFDRVDMNTVHNENRFSDFLVSTSANHPVAHSSPAILNTARMEAGDCVSLTQSNFPKMNGDPINCGTDHSGRTVGHSNTGYVDTRNLGQIEPLIARRGQQPNVNSKPCRPIILPDHFDGSVQWSDYLIHFETCAEVNQWIDSEKAKFLIVSLRGNAQQVIGDLHIEDRSDYSRLVEAIGRRFSPARQTELYRVELRNRKHKRNETLPELGQAIKRLVRLAYPQAGYELVNSLGRDYFLDALGDSDLRLQVYQARPSNIDEAVCVAVEFEAFKKAELQRASFRKSARVVSSNINSRNESDSLDNKLDKLTKTVSDFTSHQRTANREQSKFNKIIENDMKCLNLRVSEIEDDKLNKQVNRSNDFKRQNYSNKYPQGSFSCHRCGGKNHYAKECKVELPIKRKQQGN